METSELARIQQQLHALYNLQDALMQALIRFFQKLMEEDRAEGDEGVEEVDSVEERELSLYYADPELSRIGPLEGAEQYLCRVLGQIPVRLKRLRERILVHAEALEDLERRAREDHNPELEAQAFVFWMDHQKLEGEEETLVGELRVAGLVAIG